MLFVFAVVFEALPLTEHSALARLVGQQAQMCSCFYPPGDGLQVCATICRILPKSPSPQPIVMCDLLWVTENSTEPPVSLYVYGRKEDCEGKLDYHYQMTLHGTNRFTSID